VLRRFGWRRWSQYVVRNAEDLSKALACTLFAKQKDASIKGFKKHMVGGIAGYVRRGTRGMPCRFSGPVYWPVRLFLF
jgi:hypothetical protein